MKKEILSLFLALTLFAAPAHATVAEGANDVVSGLTNIIVSVVEGTAKLAKNVVVKPVGEVIKVASNIGVTSDDE